MSIKYSVKFRKGQKHIILHFKKEDGSFFVTAPKKTSLRDIDAFVQSKAQWCEKVYCAPPDTSTILLFGQSYKIKAEEGRHDMAILQNGEALVTGASSVPDEKKIKRILEKELGTMLLPRLIERVNFYCSLLGVSFKSIRITRTRRAWATCSSTGVLSFSIRCSALSEELLDYIILHECCHRLVFNHSEKFKSLLDVYMEDWRDRKKEISEIYSETLWLITG